MHPKELIVVLGLSLVVFALGKPVFLSFMRQSDFTLRRNVWLALTICAFLSPSFWLYAAFAFVLLAWAGRRDSNPAALYILAFALIPPIRFDIPLVVFNQLFPLTQARIVSIAVLLPLTVRSLQRNADGLARRLTVVDAMLVLYLILQIVVGAPYESVTNTMRRGFLFAVDTLLIFYAFSRSSGSRERIVDSLATFTMIGSLYAAIGIFESFKGWLLYEQIGPAWGFPNPGAFLMRGESLRAQASTGHSLTLGYLLAVCLGLWLYLKDHVAPSGGRRHAVTVLLCVGLFETHSRGPWLTGVVVFFAYLLVRPGSKSAFVKALVIFAAVAAVLAVTPFGAHIIDTLPFIGTVDQENVEYRQRLAQESWRLVWNNPFFGDPFVTRNMEDLRQGQGIIDLMNAYAATALFYGLVGLTLFAGFFLVVTWMTYRVALSMRSSDAGLSALGSCLVACMLASFFFLATASVDWEEYVLAGLMWAYAVAPGVRAGVRSPAASSARRASSLAWGRG